MSSPSGDITVKPEIMLLEDVLAEIADGRLRVPRFQRPFVWRPDQMIDLFDSIERGYPVGSLLVWDTAERVDSLDQIADMRIPAPPGTPVSYLLDGHQRLTTLYGCLMRRPAEHDLSSTGGWIWNIYRTLGVPDGPGGRFQHWRKPGPAPIHFLPMRNVLRTMDFLLFARELAGSDHDVERLMNEAEQLAQRIKSYKMAVVRLVGGELKHAVEVFSRLNSSGQSMSPTQMVSALTYNEGDTLADRIETLQNEIGELGFGEIPTNTLFQAVLAVSGENDVQHTRWDRLAARMRDDLDRDVKHTEKALHHAVAFLREEVGVPLARLVPYNAQLVLLTVAFHENPDPTPGQRRALQRWFWSTSWSGYFAGANTTQIRLALIEMREFAKGLTDLDLGGQQARPFPERFDLRSARVRAFVLWELRRFPHRLRPNGHMIDPVDLLLRSDASAYRQIIPRGPRRSSPANRLMLPTAPGTSARRALLEADQDLLESHGVPDAAVAWLREGDDERFLQDREHFLISEERLFIASFDVAMSHAASSAGEPEIDTV
ncbi:DUF262 domain-containing protein [Paractinoplanes brasiliensis]|uniref:DUF262 domain-containing protein n=1 Tax=Paractinoplanes brasiliensis TaxID=52695 RepID=UPI001941F0DA|nr:DUF262 domain-containing protein [Actinoplanes brasiliensis]